MYRNITDLLVNISEKIKRKKVFKVTYVIEQKESAEYDIDNFLLSYQLKADL